MGSTSAGRGSRSSILLGAAFLMATSAIGPGFITQSTVFTQKLSTSFAFVILCSIVIDIAVQLNIWRIVSVSRLHAQDLANKYYPGTGYILSLFIVIGGLAFNIGNIAGAGLGLAALMGVDLKVGAVISMVVAIALFWYRNAGIALDWFTKLLGVLMIGLTTYIVVGSNPPIAQALAHSVMPETVDTLSIITLVGGTVGGYISFAGVHRLIDDGISGPEHLKEVSRNSVRGILIVSSMRILLFLATLGVISTGVILNEKNPASSVFESVAGAAGIRIFGLVLWCASITSVVGAAYTSFTFFKTFHHSFERRQRLIITIFILISAMVSIIVGNPVQILVTVGALNAFVLPLALAILLLIARKLKKQGTYNQPMWLTIVGWVAAAALLILSLKTVFVYLTN